MVHQIF